MIWSVIKVSLHPGLCVKQKCFMATNDTRETFVLRLFTSRGTVQNARTHVKKSNFAQLRFGFGKQSIRNYSLCLHARIYRIFGTRYDPDLNQSLPPPGVGEGGLASKIHSHFKTWSVEPIPVSVKSVHVFKTLKPNRLKSLTL